MLLGNNFKWSSPLRGQDVGDKWFFTEWSVWNGYRSPKNLPLREWLPLKVVWALESPVLTTPEPGGGFWARDAEASSSVWNTDRMKEKSMTGRSHWSSSLYLRGWGSVISVPSRHRKLECLSCSQWRLPPDANLWSQKASDFSFLK